MTICISRRRRVDFFGPPGEIPRIFPVESVQYQRGQCEVIDHMLLMISLVNIRDVILVRDMCFCNLRNTRSDAVNHIAEKLDNLVGLRQVDAFSAGFGPYIGDGIQPQDVRAVPDIKQDTVHYLH